MGIAFFERAELWLQILSGFIVILGGACGLLAWLAGAKASSLRQAEQDKVRQRSEQKISAANRDAATALSEARNAEAYLASAQERAEIARADAENARLQAAEANRIAKSFELRLEQQREATANAELRATNAERISKNAEASSRKAEEGTREIKAGMEPRHISDDQRTKLLKILSSIPKGPISIGFSGADSEARDYANEVLTIFQSSGWHIEKGITQYLDLMTTGINILVKTTDSPPIHAGYIQNGFKSVGIDIQGKTFKNVEADRVILLVGKKY